ncbi:hypothetical protein AVEN_202163-1 [Araneus ventricosus]|uniref:Uncharacterized protein n=1 Tax=Araneus ventricosus TaxID=182803 RepID=A0A4Y2LBL1_ARAVE|nr:hypothetical protein AVEN_202163-1 [Araneus ventricosus]
MTKPLYFSGSDAYHCRSSGLTQSKRKDLAFVMNRKCAMSLSPQTCFTCGEVDYAMLLCRSFVANLSRQVCHDKIISRKITFAANVHAIYVMARQS